MRAASRWSRDDSGARRGRQGSMTMKRRDLFLAAGAGALAAPGLAEAQAARVLRYVPHANLPNIDPFTNTAFVARDHAFLVFDQLYGMNDKFEPQPQMAQGHV